MTVQQFGRGQKSRKNNVNELASTLPAFYEKAPSTIRLRNNLMVRWAGAEPITSHYYRTSCRNCRKSSLLAFRWVLNSELHEFRKFLAPTKTSKHRIAKQTITTLDAQPNVKKITICIKFFLTLLIFEKVVWQSDPKFQKSVLSLYKI